MGGEVIGHLPREAAGSSYGRERHGFISSITPLGEVHLAASLLRSETRVVAVVGEPGSGRSELLSRVGGEAQLRGMRAEYHHKPIDPSVIEHVYVPEADILFTVQPELMPRKNLLATYELSQCATPWRDGEAAEIESAKSRYSELLGDAVASLLDAKNTHAALEQYYVPHMDFSGVDQRRESVVETLKHHSALFA